MEDENGTESESFNRSIISHHHLGTNVFAYLAPDTDPLARAHKEMYFKAEMQRYDGWYNNLAHPAWGSTGEFYLINWRTIGNQIEILVLMFVLDL